MLKPGRNDPCPCGSGKKYKKCCGGARPAREIPKAPLSKAGPASQMMEFIQPLLDDPAGMKTKEELEHALLIGQVAWNMSLLANSKERVRFMNDFLATFPGSRKDRKEFRQLIESMVERHHRLFPEMHDGRHRAAGLVGGVDEHHDRRRQKAKSLPKLLDGKNVEELLSLPLSAETWYGGRRKATCVIEKPRPHHPQLVLWVEADRGQVMGYTFQAPEAGYDGLWEPLIDSMRRPMVGEPRRPAKIVLEQLEQAEIARPLMQRLGIGVDVGSPEPVDVVFKSLEKVMAESAPPLSYLQNGRVHPISVARFFAAGAKLIRTAPWNHAFDQQAIEVDIGVRGVLPLCVSVMGAAGINRGLAIFESLADLERFSELGAEKDNPDIETLDISSWSLMFEKASELDENLRKEAMQHRWEVADPDSYPLLLRLTPGIVDASLSERDYRIAGICAEAVARFFDAHADLFKSARPRLTSEEYQSSFWPGRNRVRITAPHPGLMAP